MSAGFIESRFRRVPVEKNQLKHTIKNMGFRFLYEYKTRMEKRWKSATRTSAS